MSFKQLRAQYGDHIERNRLVLFEGDLYRLKKVVGGLLVIRNFINGDQTRVSPDDPSIDWHPPREDIVAASAAVRQQEREALADSRLPIASPAVPLYPSGYWRT